MPLLLPNLLVKSVTDSQIWTPCRSIIHLPICRSHQAMIKGCDDSQFHNQSIEASSGEGA